MENRKLDVSRWVEDRLASLDPDSRWNPNSRHALEKLRQRDRGRVGGKRPWIWAAVAASVAGAAVLVMLAPPACATPTACARTIWDAAFSRHPPVAATVQPADSPAFKQAGSPSAPLTCEIYTDYECPACARLYTQTIPMLMADYVRTGKVRLIHRDYPLAMHAYSKLAARYANAAGMVGQYDVAANRLFQTQPLWSREGDIDTQLAQVLPPDVMQKVRDLVANDRHLDDSVAADMAMGAKDHLTQTPTLVVVYGGKRQVVAGDPDYSLLKSYFDRILAK